jgi:surface-anchored protein
LGLALAKTSIVKSIRQDRYSEPRAWRSGFLTAVAALMANCAWAAAADVSIEYIAEGHVDVSILYSPAATTNRLGIVVQQESRGLTFLNHELVLVAGEAARFELPAGTPFGNAGDPLWILPQGQYAGVPYLGFSTEQVANHAFEGPIGLTLHEIDMPGRFDVGTAARFYLWQAGQIGDLRIWMNSADGISEADSISLPASAHAHYNWGFSSPGLWHLTFTTSGRASGESTDITSAPVTFAFHVLPLSGFEHWQSTNWPPATPRSVIGPEADPDGDGVVNLVEYALGMDPKIHDSDGLPKVTIISDESQSYGAVSYNRNKAAAGISYEVLAASSIDSGDWQVLTGNQTVVDLGAIELVTVRDPTPLSGDTHRFYKLRVRMSN